MTRRKTRIPKVLPVAPNPDSNVREYYRFLRRYAEKYNALVKAGLEALIPDLKEVAADEIPEPLETSRSDTSERYNISCITRNRMDAPRYRGSLKTKKNAENINKQVEYLFEDVHAELEKSFPDAQLEKWAKTILGKEVKASKKNMSRLMGVVGVQIEPLLHDRGMGEWLQNRIDENVGLIRSIPTEKEVGFKNALVSLITQDANIGEIQKSILKHIGKSGNVKARARLIARDQVGKFNADMNQYRQQQLGAEEYIWTGSNDSRERPDHRRLNGTKQRWDKPPIVDRRTGRRAHPGKDYQCRCRAKMVVGDILD